jgi:hypothetical protein
MEVHHHGHAHEKKSWKGYFWEFLMLFLAVFCGFLAENFREHYVEAQRARSLAKNLYDEVLGDSASIQDKVAIRLTKEKECSYFINYVRDSNLTNLSPHFMLAFSWTFIQSQRMFFDPNDGMLTQLRNSGELRYFKDPAVQVVLGKLNVAIANIRERNKREYTFIENNLRSFSLRYYDFKWYEEFIDNGALSLSDALVKKGELSIAGQIQNVSQFNRLEAQSLASYQLLMLRGTRSVQYTEYMQINHEVLQLLREEYHMK